MAHNDDHTIESGSNLQSPPNSAQEGELSKNAGTASTNSPNLSGAGNAQSNANTSNTDAPGRRLKNPLGYLASSTYQLSLYMITPDAYDAFQSTGRTSIDALAQASGESGSGGAYLIAQSGGINNDTSQRAPGFEWDYYIDKLVLSQAISGSSSQSATNIYDVKFEILEPYGFSFNTKLKQANDALQQYFNDSGYSKDGAITNPSRQFFVLGVQFLGYDINGNIVYGNQEFADGPLDPAASGTGLFKAYYDIMITSVKFKIDGSATRYSLTGAAIAPGLAFNAKRGYLTSSHTICGSTIEDALTGKRGLLTQLNKREQGLKESGAITVANQYKVEFIGDDADNISKATLINPLDTDKSKWCDPEAPSNTEEANDASAAKLVPADAQRRIVFADGTPMLDVFDQLVKDSSFLREALDVVYSNNPEPSLDKKKQESEKGGNKAVAWYHVTPSISQAKWDPLTSDWAYITTYRIETYQTPVLTAATVNPGMKYYGPHKRYEYWWTGENREILSYEQVVDNLYYNEVLANTDSNKSGVATSGAAQTPLKVTGKTSMPTLNSLAGGAEAQNNFVTTLYSPDAYATAKIKLLGDPDFLVSDNRGGPNEVYQRFYDNDGFRVNANGGQVFIEIDFKEAMDYNNETGVLDINDSILFWKYPAWAEKQIKGVSYQVVLVKSTFDSGIFTQDLEAVINTFADAGADEKAKAAGLSDADREGDESLSLTKGTANEDMSVIPAEITSGNAGSNSTISNGGSSNDDATGT